MPRPESNPFRKFFSFNLEKNTSTCLVESDNHRCGKEISGKHGTNLTNHIKRCHFEVLEKNEKEKALKKLEKNKPSEVNSSKTELPKIDQFLTKSVSVRITKESIKEACVLLCTVDGRPFSCVNDVGFRLLLDPIIKGMGCENFINPQNVRDSVVEKADLLTKKIRKEVEGKVVSLKIDGLTHLARSFIGVNIQYINNGKIVLRTLATEEMFACHTGQHLKDVVLTILSRFGISSKQVYSCTTDNGRNMLKMVELLNQDCEDESDEQEDADDEMSCLSNFDFDSKCIGIKCAAHTLQLAVNSVLNKREFSGAIASARSLVKKLRTPIHGFSIDWTMVTL
ncbi:hypothetical protein ACLKA7_012139 [Drosophila subpalustris]